MRTGTSRAARNPWRQWLRVVLVVVGVVYVTTLFGSDSGSASVRSDLPVLLTQTPTDYYAGLSRKYVRPSVVTERRLECVGWYATSECKPDGPREPQNDKNCSETIGGGQSGYCVVQDLDTGERFQVMRRHCNGLKWHVSFSCADAPAFAQFHTQAHEAAKKVPPPSSQFDGTRHDGIVMVVYPKLLASAYATVRVLRDVLKSRLPIEIWYHVHEVAPDSALLAPLQQLADDVGGVTFATMDSPRTRGFFAKIFAITNSEFDCVLFLDADNVPVRDPTFLFDSPKFVDTGAVFWPDFWQPRHTLFDIYDTSMLWELLDIPFVDMSEQESGQLLVDRTRHAAPLAVVNFFAFGEPNFFEKLSFGYGDKDLFRFAWIMLNSSYHMIETPPAMAGRAENGTFCGMTMVQHDQDGEVLFLHRNQFKLTGEIKAIDPAAETVGAPQLDKYPDPVIWTHLQSFRKNKSLENYRIDAYRVPPTFPSWQPCYGKANVDDDDFFETEEIASLSFAGMEKNVRRYALEAAHRLHARQFADEAHILGENA